MSKNRPISSPQRALVFQGGGSLGAYEAGVFHVLYHWIKKDLADNENVYDIIAGTSIGAINASIIINHFLENKEKDIKTPKEEKPEKTLKYWEGSPEKLLNFWKKISSYSTFYDSILSLLKNTWDFNKDISAKMFPYYQNFIDLLVSGESLRRYYSIKKRIVYGEPNVFSPLFYPPFPTPLFNKFFDYSQSAWWYQYNNKPLGESILDFARKLEYDQYYKEGGISTNIEQNEPKLLLVAADINTAQPETFDSNESGITINHVLASAAIPINYPYMEINGKKYWDGGILSNTPIRELISNHSSFWTKKYERKLISTLDQDSKLTFAKWKDFYKLQEENIIPNLKLTIVNLHPQSEEGNNIPSLYDYDLTKDRERDIRFHDKTEYDIKLAQNISDYHDFVVEMTNLASQAINENAQHLKPKFEDILNNHQRTSSRDNQTRHFYDLIGKRFNIEDVLKIQKKDDIDTVSDKIFDFSSDTILNLIKEGERDTLKEIVDHEEQKQMEEQKEKGEQKMREEDKLKESVDHDFKKEDKNSIKNQLMRFIKDVEKESTEDDEYIIHCAKDESERKKYFIEIQ